MSVYAQIPSTSYKIHNTQRFHLRNKGSHMFFVYSLHVQECISSGIFKELCYCRWVLENRSYVQKKYQLSVRRVRNCFKGQRSPYLLLLFAILYFYEMYPVLESLMNCYLTKKDTFL